MRKGKESRQFPGIILILRVEELISRSSREIESWGMPIHVRMEISSPPSLQTESKGLWVLSPDYAHISLPQPKVFGSRSPGLDSDRLYPITFTTPCRDAVGRVGCLFVLGVSNAGFEFEGGVLLSACG